MSALPPNNTARVWVKYTDGINEHELLIRHNTATADVADVLDFADDLFTQIADSWYQIGVLGARASSQHSDFSFPTAWPHSPTYGGGAMPKVFSPRQFCLLGRTSLGHRIRFFLFGYEGTSPDDYRLARGSGNIVDDALTVIEAAQLNGIGLCIDGQVPVMYQYADFNFNNYYERQARS